MPLRASRLVLFGSVLFGSILVSCGGAPVPVSPAASSRIDLVDELATADVRGLRGRLRLADPAARNHLLDGFSFLEEDHSGTYIWAVGERSEVEIFLPRPRSFRWVVHARPFQPEGAPPQRVTLTVNGEAVGRHVVDPTADRFAFDVPRRVTRVGPNVLTLGFEEPIKPSDWIPESRDRRPLTLQISSFEIAGQDESCEPGRRAVRGRDDESRYGLDMGSGCRVAWMEELSSADRLVIAPLDDASVVGLEGLLRLVGPSGVRSEHVFDARAGLDLPLAEVAMDAGQGEPVQIELWTRARSGFLAATPAPSARVLWSVDLVSDSAVASGSGSESPAPSLETATEDGRHPDVLIYVVDTLRADRLGVYGNERGLTPNFDLLAEDGVVFLEARAQTSWTRTAMVSVMTGLYPQTHGVNDRDDGLAGDVATLAESFAATGYQTVAAITNGNVDSRFGLGRGFDVYQYLRESSDDEDFHVTSDEVDAWLALWLTTLGERPAETERRPFLLYAHVTDPHAPYTPHEPFRSRFAAEARRELGLLETVRAIDTGELAAGEDEARDLMALYDAEVAFVDHHFGVLVERLKRLGLYDSMTILVLSDHGEEFYEHGNWEHGETLYDEQLRVPFLLKLPGNEAAGSRLPVRAGHVDVLPTLVSLVGAAMRAEIDGRSLLPAIRGEDAVGGAPTLAYLALEEKQMRSLVDDGRKLVLDSRSIDRLFDLGQDPAEHENLSARRLFERALLAQRLRRLEWDLAAVGRQAESVEIDPELRKQLEALGYIQ